MRRLAIILSLTMISTPAFAEAEKQEVCGHQGDIASAISEARVNGVREKRVEKKILADDPTWPANYNKAIPTLASWVYQLDINQVKQNDLGAIWKQQCLDNWEAIQQSLGN